MEYQNSYWVFLVNVLLNTSSNFNFIFELIRYFDRLFGYSIRASPWK